MSYIQSIGSYYPTSKNYIRKQKIETILGLPEKNEFISPGIYTSEKD